MNKKLLVLCLSLVMALTGCQTDSVSEEIQVEELSISKEKTKTDEVTSKIHNPDWMIAIHNPDWMIAIHNPDWMIEGHEICADLDEYTGSKNLVVPHSSDPQEYGGLVELNKLNVGGILSICGELNVEKSVNIRHSGELNLTGFMMVGTYEEPQDLTINYGGHLNLNGTLIVTGDLILNNGFTMEFNNDLEHNNLVVEGEIIIENPEQEITGQYTDHSDHEHEH
ncbi:hypothetical protein [Christiangramia crocea]|uniref:Polymer-forming cytoskeletal protein n=1 Tax=Christiangramia crocea TaxID=2904124 RepID=A0A9X1UVK6_9FLAO|nr:hypothetical protein [Gramella crocea]MCG9971124.1 hypothetical protein [Gramella crocea]